MLIKTTPYKATFDVLMQSNANFHTMFRGRNHISIGTIWEVANTCIKVLTAYQNRTKQLSSINYPTVQSYISLIYLLDDVMKDNQDDVKLGGIITIMKSKKKEYQSSSDKINILFFVALTLDSSVRLKEIEDICNPYMSLKLLEEY